MTAVNAIRAFFVPLLVAYPALVYLGTYLSIIIVGNVVSFATLWLAFQGELDFKNFLGVVGLVLFADISGDLAWYWLGRKLRGTRLGEFLHRHLPKHEEIEGYITANSKKWIFLSKFIPSSTFTIIFLVGWSKIDFKKFFSTSLLAIFSSVAILVALAFGLATGLSGLEAATVFKKYERLFLLAVILFLVINFVLGKLFRSLVRRGQKA